MGVGMDWILYSGPAGIVDQSLTPLLMLTTLFISTYRKNTKKGNQIIVTAGEILWSLLKLPTFLH